MVVLAGCGGSKHAAAPSATATMPGSSTPKTPTTGGGKTTTGAAPLQAEAQSAAAGDIPDNQVFLTFRNGAGGYTIKYPEGWAQTGSGDRVTFRDKNNIVRILVAAGGEPTPARAQAELGRLAGAQVTQAPGAITIGGTRALKVSYATVSPPNPVTGKRVRLVVDRYYLARAGKLAIVDLGTPEGVDNVDAYRLMIESFRWR